MYALFLPTNLQEPPPCVTAEASEEYGRGGGSKSFASESLTNSKSIRSCGCWTAPEKPVLLPPKNNGVSPAHKRLSFLFQASLHLAALLPSLSRLLQKQLQEVARRHVVRLHASLKHVSCQRCLSVLSPPFAKVRRLGCCKEAACCCLSCSRVAEEREALCVDAKVQSPHTRGEKRDSPKTAARARRKRRSGRKRRSTQNATLSRSTWVPLTDIECLVCGLHMRRP